MNTVLISLVLSVVIQNIFAIRRSGVINPVLLLSAINYLHNWADSVAMIFDPNFSINSVLIEVTDGLLTKTLIMALVAQWIFFLVFFYYSGYYENRGASVNSSSLLEIKRVNLEKVKLFYFLILVSAVAVSTVFGSHSPYGSGTQASTASAAFSPISAILGLRIFFLGFILICEGLCGRKKFAVFALFAEMVLATLSGGRKMVFLALLMYLFAFLFREQRRNIPFGFSKKILPLLLAAVVGIFLVVFVLYVRIGMGIGEAFYATIEQFITTPGFIFTALASSNSQPLQAWVIELVDQGDLDLLYGKSYLQAIINTVVLRPFQGELVNWQAAYAFKAVAYPNINNHGWDFCFAGETYLNFKNFFWIPYLILSIVINKLFFSRFESIFRMFLSVGIFSICFVAFRCDSTTMFRYFSMFIFIFFLMKYLLGLRRNISPRSLPLKKK